MANKEMAELVFIPAPGMGHLVSTLEVAKLLLDLNHNISITLFILKQNAYVESLTTGTPTSSRLKFIILPQHDQIPEHDAYEFMTALIQTQWPYVKEFVKNIVHRSQSDPNSPRLAGFVLDMFLTPMIDLANEFGVPSYVFFASSAAFLGFSLYMQALHDDQNIDIISEFKDSDAELDIPSFVNSFPAKVFPSTMLKPDTLILVLNMSRKIKEAKGIMVNTFVELESHAVESLTMLPPLYPVGPILNLKSNVSGAANQNTRDVTTWLDNQTPSSVGFLCFGSMGVFGGDQVREIAYALEHSGYPFLWSLHQHSKDQLPEGFLDRTANLGKIIGWAPQVEILGHPAIGGFVSHCGWNSTLESLWFGVPMATWPLYAEQQLNAFQMVSELGLAHEIKMDFSIEIPMTGDAEIVKAEKIEGGIRCLMEQDSDVRRKVKEISEKSKRALMDGGSSLSTLRSFINQIM